MISFSVQGCTEFWVPAALHDNEDFAEALAPNEKQASDALPTRLRYFVNGEMPLKKEELADLITVGSNNAIDCLLVSFVARRP